MSELSSNIFQQSLQQNKCTIHHWKPHQNAQINSNHDPHGREKHWKIWNLYSV